jgi:hypothetical protein
VKELRDRGARTALLTLSQSYKSDEAFITGMLVAAGLLVVLVTLLFAADVSEGFSLLPL